MILASPPSKTATAEFVVPKSIPIILLIIENLLFYYMFNLVVSIFIVLQSPLLDATRDHVADTLFAKH
ncbi:hypothetical protein DTPHA_1407085 [Enterococcus faecium]|nr:hypothetical protein DTPHA_1407085 [Enterococcus faecium]